MSLCILLSVRLFHLVCCRLSKGQGSIILEPLNMITTMILKRWVHVSRMGTMNMRIDTKLNQWNTSNIRKPELTNSTLRRISIVSKKVLSLYDSKISAKINIYVSFSDTFRFLQIVKFMELNYYNLNLKIKTINTFWCHLTELKVIRNILIHGFSSIWIKQLLNNFQTF